MPVETQQPVTRENAPNWAAVSFELLCPRCDYDLRGLVEPRCPECGYTFSWQALFGGDGSAQQAFLFEGTSRRLLRAGARTLTFSLVRPFRFWRHLRPGYRLSIGRLLVYWLGVSIVILALTGMPLLVSPVSTAYAQVARRIEMKPLVNSPQFASWRKSFPSTQAFLDEAAPLPSWNRFSSDLSLAGRYDVRRHVLAPMAFSSIVWPGLTFLSLLAMAPSLRRQRHLSAAHLLRCALYSADAAVLLPVVVTMLMLFSFSASLQRLQFVALHSSAVNATVFAAAAVVALLVTLRLAVACWKYLGLSLISALPTAGLSQLTALLLLYGLLLLL